MTVSRSPTWLPIIAVMAPVTGAPGWLLFGFAGGREAGTALPDAWGSTNVVDAWTIEDGSWLRLRSAEAAPTRKRALGGREIALPVTATGGLGLRLYREIYRALGTRIEARPRADGGVEFGFTLRAVTAGGEEIL